MLIGNELGFVIWMSCLVAGVPYGRLRDSGFGFATGMIFTLDCFKLNVTGMFKVAPFEAAISTIPVYVPPGSRPTELTVTIRGVVARLKGNRVSMVESQFCSVVVMKSSERATMVGNEL